MDVTRSRTQPNVFSRRLFAPLAGRYDRLAEILSMGQNGRWRTAMVEHITGSDARLVLDVACGPARVSRAIADETSAHVIGLDLSDSMIAQVKPGGPISSLEFAVPPAPWWRIAWWCYTRIILPIAGFVTGGRAWFDVGRFLGPSIDTHYRKYPVDWTVKAWKDAGIGDVGTRRMSLGGGLIMWGRRA